MSAVTEARWALYWRAYKDMRPGEELPSGECPAVQEDFQRWWDKVRASPDWYIAPGVTTADREAAAL